MSLLDDIAGPPQNAGSIYLGLIGKQQDMQLQQQDAQDRHSLTQSRLVDAGIDQQAKQYSLADVVQAARDNTVRRSATVAATNPVTGEVDRPALLAHAGQLDPYIAAKMASEFQGQDAEGKAAQVKQDQQQAVLTKTQLENQKAQLENAGQHSSYIAQHLQGIADQPTPQLQQSAWTNSRNQMIKDGILQPGGNDDPGETYDGQKLSQMMTQNWTQQQALANQQKATAAKLDQAEASEKARSDKAHEAIEWTRVKTEQQQARTADMYVTPSGAGKTGDDFLLSVNPAVRQQVKSIASGDLAMPSPNSRAPGAQALRNAVLQYDPTYMDSRYATRQAFKNKGDATSVVQLSTAMEHLENLKANSAKVGLAPLLSYNATGDDAAYNKDMQLFSQETGKLVKNGVLTEGEYKDLQTGLNSSRQNVRDSASSELAKLLGGKVSGVFQKYRAGTGQDLPVSEFFDQPTQSRLQRFGVVQGSGTGGGSIVVTAPDGSKHAFQTQQQADRFKTLAKVQ